VAAAALLGPVAIVPGSATRTIVTPVNLLGASGTLRITVNTVVADGDVTITVSGSDDGVSWVVITTHSANALSTLNADGVGDVSIAEIPVPPLPANLKFDSVSTASFTLLVEQV